MTNKCQEGVGSSEVPAPASMRIQKYLARSGAGSRRHCEQLMSEGRVTVNGAVVQTLGTKVIPGTDVVAVDGKTYELPSEVITFMLHKPAGYVTTMDDPQGRPTVASLLPLDEHPALFPVGRLDIDTTGLLLCTTDGELGHQLMHPRFHVPKRYIALVEGALSEEEAEQLRHGIQLEDGMTAPAKLWIATAEEKKRWADLMGTGEGASGSKRHGGRRSRAALEKSGTWVAIEICEGRNRQVRRMFEALDHPVIALHRQSYGPLTLEGLERGSLRMLSDEECAALQTACHPREE